MLSKADKKWIKETMRQVITEALTVQVEMEQKRDLKTGVPLKTPRHFQKEIYLPAHWVEFLPFYEQAIVGVQETGDHAKNRAVEARDKAGELEDKVNALGEILIGLENPLKAIAQMSDMMQLEYTNQKRLKIMLDINNVPKKIEGTGQPPNPGAN